MNAITLLKQDHGNVEALFERYERLGPDQHDEKRRVVDLLVEQLSTHAAIEEQFFYPAVREASDDGAKLALEGLEEHHLVKLTLHELEKMPPTDERFDAKVTVLIESVRHHVEEEEKDLFAAVRRSMKANQLEQLGDVMEAAKAAAPTRPHPLLPDVPPFNVILGAPAAVLDRVVTTARDVAGKVLRRAS